MRCGRRMLVLAGISSAAAPAAVIRLIAVGLHRPVDSARPIPIPVEVWDWELGLLMLWFWLEPCPGALWAQ